MSSALDMELPDLDAASIGEPPEGAIPTAAPSAAPKGSTSRRPSGVTSAVPLATTRPKSKKKKGAAPVSALSAALGAGGGSLGNQGENTGRWTAEEHRLFLQGLEQHGKGWKKIASLIKSRTVVQIRTHAQKYFQKLAKARQNGDDENAVTFLEGRGGAGASITSASTIVVAPRRRRQVTGTKRKVLSSIVASAQRQEKKHALLNTGVPNPFAVAIAPTLAYFVAPGTTGASEAAAPETLSGSAIEDSLFRFLTPCPPVDDTDPQVNEVARQAGANPITLPPDNVHATIAGGEISPTGVADLSIYPSWTDAKETPSWYAKGADVDNILEVADTLDWLADTGDMHETYVGSNGDDSSETGLYVKQSTSVSTLPHVESNMETMVPTLPSLFDNEVSESGLLNIEPSSTNDFKSLHTSVSGLLDPHLQVFDSPIEEHAFVSTILEDDANEDLQCLPSLG